MTRPARVAVALTVALLVPGCTSSADTAPPTASPTGGPTPSTPEGGPVGEAACPDERAGPDPDRPRITLDFRLEDELTTVTGTERVVFTPDLPTDELVFRLVPNAPDSSAAGNRLEVDAVTGDGVTGGD